MRRLRVPAFAAEIESLVRRFAWRSTVEVRAVVEQRLDHRGTALDHTLHDVRVAEAGTRARACLPRCGSRRSPPHPDDTAAIPPWAQIGGGVGRAVSSSTIATRGSSRRPAGSSRAPRCRCQDHEHVEFLLLGQRLAPGGGPSPATREIPGPKEPRLGGTDNAWCTMGTPSDSIRSRPARSQRPRLQAATEGLYRAFYADAERFDPDRPGCDFEAIWTCLAAGLLLGLDADLWPAPRRRARRDLHLHRTATESRTSRNVPNGGTVATTRRCATPRSAYPQSPAPPAELPRRLRRADPAQIARAHSTCRPHS